MLRAITGYFDRTPKLLQTAEKYADELAAMPRLQLGEVDRNPTIQKMRPFHRILRNSSLNHPSLDRFRKEFHAAKLGIHSSVFDKNPGLLDFVAAHYLERYLEHFGDHLEVDPDTQLAKIKVEGRMKPWEAPPQNLSQETNGMSWPWMYGVHGLQTQDLYAWKELIPYKFEENPSWGDRYIFEICMCGNDSVQLTGAHTWVRLKTPRLPEFGNKAAIYSVGLYRPGKGDHFLSNYDKPFRVKPGQLQSPEVSEFWPTKIRTIPVEISKEAFERVKQKVEADKSCEPLEFQSFNRSCTVYANSLANIAGINFPCMTASISLLTPEKVQNIALPLLRKLPDSIVNKLDQLQACGFNLLQLALGAHEVDPAVLAINQAAKPHIALSLSDLFDPKKAMVGHPLTLATTVREEIEAWRKETGRPYDLPEKFLYQSKNLGIPTSKGVTGLNPSSREAFSVSA